MKGVGITRSRDQSDPIKNPSSRIPRIDKLWIDENNLFPLPFSFYSPLRLIRLSVFCFHSHNYKLNRGWEWRKDGCYSFELRERKGGITIPTFTNYEQLYVDVNHWITRMLDFLMRKIVFCFFCLFLSSSFFLLYKRKTLRDWLDVYRSAKVVLLIYTSYIGLT